MSRRAWCSQTVSSAAVKDEKFRGNKEINTNELRFGGDVLIGADLEPLVSY